MATVDMEFDVDTALAEGTQLCRTHYTYDTQLIIEGVTFPEPALPCPCSMSQAQLDPRFEEDQQFGNEGGSPCFVQREPFPGTTAIDTITYGQQCCYDTTG